MRRARILANLNIGSRKPLAEVVQRHVARQVLPDRLVNLFFPHDASRAHYLSKVSKRHLRDIWNDPAFQADLLRRATQRVDVYEGLAPPGAQQAEGAISYVFDLIDNMNAKLLGTFHCYKNPDGSIGASGFHDPQWFLVNDILLFDP
jgi:hypothetical protein